jgi:hypothetical protein
MTSTSSGLIFTSRMPVSVFALVTRKRARSGSCSRSSPIFSAHSSLTRYRCLLEERKRQVLRSRAVLQADQLIDLEERALGLWYMDTQPAAARRVSVQMPVLDCVPRTAASRPLAMVALAGC